MINQEEIKKFLEGNDPEEHIISVEFDYPTNSIYKIKEDPKKGKIVVKDSFTPFAWVGNLKDSNFYKNSKEDQKKAINDYGIIIEKLRTDDDPRLESGYKYIVKSVKGYRQLVQFFRDGGLDPWGTDLILLLPPTEQYLISKEKRLFKGLEEYDDIHRLVFDLETTALNPKDGRIFMIGINSNRGFKRVIECSDEISERNGIIEFFKIIDELKPSIIGGYYSSNFDWMWIFERCKALRIDIKEECLSLHPDKTLSTSEKMLKLGNEIEKYTQVSLWGYNIIDIVHSVRRAQAINSDIKSAGLKYITKYLQIEAKDRVYIKHEDIGSMYKDKRVYWLNTTNGNYKLANNPEYDNLDSKFPGVYIKVTGDNIVERYLDDDLEETLLVDEQFNQASFLLAKLVPTTYEKIATMGTASLWKMLMLSWSYKYKLAVPMNSEKKPFVGGLSRLLKVGYSKNVLKLDFSSLYPSIQLVHDIFPKCDITGAMKAMLKYFRDTRIMYKELSEQFNSTDSKKSKSFDRKQLPIKIFINSLFGGLSAPHVFPWGDMDCGEQITCTGRQYLRMMIKFFIKKGYMPLVMDTDGVNFSKPDDLDNRIYIGKGFNWKVKKGFEYKGSDADVAEFNDTFMRGEMALDIDGTWPACINIARKNYAVINSKGKIKLTGNTIKSKKLPLYIETFLDKAIKLLLDGNGKDFIEYYYEYIDKIWNKQVPLREIAQRAKVKLTVDDYIKRSQLKNKAGNTMSKMAHMELAILHNLDVKLGDVIYYVNNGTKVSHGDVVKVTSKKDPDGPSTKLNCYMLDNSELENNPDMLGDYNVAKAISILNTRIQPLLVVFKNEVRDTLLVSDPSNRNFYTTNQCELINGEPFESGDQDSLEEVMTPSDMEDLFWKRVNLSKDYMYELASENWAELV